MPRRADRWAVIMAGGTGTRFWPRSRRRLPKQLLRITGPRTLLQDTVARLRGLVPLKQTLIVTHRDHAQEVRRQLRGIPAANVLVEPVGRNTAPCLALATLEITRRAPHATFASLPADHTIADVRRFRTTLAEGYRLANRERCPVTIGIRPSGPETGYGYIRVGAPLTRDARWVRAFVEKPVLAAARRFVRSGEYLWNSGMFVWRADTVLALLDRHLPSLTATLRPATVGRGRGAALARAYRSIAPASIDYAIMEKTDRVIVVPGDFGWNDVGSWAAVADLDGTKQGGRAPVVAVDASGNVVFNPERLVALVGVNDVIVVDAPDAILICRKDRAQDVRDVVAELERRRLDAYL
jgi:mannose-1-phosphate guanylyltransferase